MFLSKSFFIISCCVWLLCGEGMSKHLQEESHPPKVLLWPGQDTPLDATFDSNSLSILYYKYVVRAHFVQALQNSTRRSADPRDESIVKMVVFKRFEGGSLHICWAVETVIVMSTIRTADESWQLSGEFCPNLMQAKVFDMNKVSSKEAAELTSDSLKITPYTNGSKGIEGLIKFDDTTNCSRNAFKRCSRGSVEMDSWLNRTLQFQRHLSRDTELNYVQFLGTHNSFNNKADGYGTGDFYLGELLQLLSDSSWTFVWAQQWFTMTDQLNMGVREVMLDPVYVFGGMKLCHCGTTFKWIDRVIQWLDQVLNKTIEFDSDQLGCMPYDRSFVSGLVEILEWLSHPWNENEFIIIHINDEGRQADWDQISLIQKPIEDLFGNIAFTPSDKKKYFSTRWPTLNELVAMDRRILIYGDRVQNDFIFPDFTLPNWDKNAVKYFSPAPSCGLYSPDQWYIVGGESQVVGPIYNGPAAEGLVVLDNLPYLMQCGISITSMDLLSPPLLAGAVWSWAPGYPDESKDSCAAMNISDSGI